MKGFTDKALILLSKPHGFEEYGSIYRYDYQLAVQNVVEYLHSMDVSHDCLITDGLAARMNMYNPRWLATGTPEDMFFMKNFCGVPDYPTVALSAELVERVRSKYEV